MGARGPGAQGSFFLFFGGGVSAPGGVGYVMDMNDTSLALYIDDYSFINKD